MDLSGVTMKFKLKNFKQAFNSFSYTLPEGAEIEILVREEDIQQSKLCSTMTMVASFEKKAAAYDNNSNPTYVTVTIEVFPESENRPFKITTVETRDGLA